MPGQRTSRRRLDQDRVSPAVVDDFQDRGPRESFQIDEGRSRPFAPMPRSPREPQVAGRDIHGTGMVGDPEFGVLGNHLMRCDGSIRQRASDRRLARRAGYSQADEYDRQRDGPQVRRRTARREEAGNHVIIHIFGGLQSLYPPDAGSYRNSFVLRFFLPPRRNSIQCEASPGASPKSLTFPRR